MIRVTNVGATAYLGCAIDSIELDKVNRMALYDPKRFSGLLIRRLAPIGTHSQVWLDGKITVNGGTSVAQSLALAKLLALEVERRGFPIS